MAALGELLHSECLGGASSLAGDCEQEPNPAILCRPLKDPIAQSEHISTFPRGSTCAFSQQNHF